MLFSLLFSIVVMAARTLGDDVFIVLRRDDVCMKEQSCPGHGLWEQCDHGPSGGKRRVCLRPAREGRVV